MKPGHPEYREAAKSILTASVFGAACGLNPYCSRQQLWKLKTGRAVFDGNERTQYGNDNEHLAMARYEAITGSLVAPGRFCMNPLYPNMGATPDGFVEKRILEAKSPVSGLYKRIPVYYLCQVVGQIELCDAELCGAEGGDFFAWTPEESKLWEVSRSKAAWEVMLPFLESMVNYIRSDIEPPRFKKGEKLDPDKFRALIEVEEV